MVLPLDPTHFQSPRSGFILQAQVRHINVLHAADSLSVEDVLRSLCIDHQHKFLCIRDHPHEPLRFGSRTTPALGESMFFLRQSAVVVKVFSACKKKIQGWRNHTWSERVHV